MDDVRSINTESTTSLGQEFEQKQDTLENSTSSSLSSAPPGTVKQRPPKEKSMNDQDVIHKLQELCANADPLLIYSNMEKIGQGYVSLKQCANKQALNNHFFFFVYLKKCFRRCLYRLSSRLYYTRCYQTNELGKAA